MIYLGSNQITKIYLGGSDLAAAYLAETKVYPEGAHDYSQDYFTTVALDSGDISLSGSNTANTFSYSTDEGATWSTPAQVNIVSASNGDKVLWKGTPTPEANAKGIGRFSTVTTANFNAEGNVMSLLYGDNFQGQTELSGKDWAFPNLFSNITHLVSAENLILPATTLSTRCYQRMFNGCTSLTTLPKLPATTLAHGCYYGMFNGCINLTEAPKLSATTLAPSGYSQMFSNCTSLTTAPELPATTLAESCYASMLRNCTSLTKAPELPATTLADSCYYNMFNGCTSLTAAPALPATTLANQCYYNMFRDCTSLTSITCLATDISASNCTTNWVNGVASSGTFYKAAEMENWQIDSVNGIPQGWTVKNYGDYSTQYFTTVALGSGNISLSGSNTANTFSYSTDNGSTWSTPAQVNSVPVSNGDKVMWKGTSSPIQYYGIGKFTTATTANFNVEGNAMSLLYGDNFQGQTDLTGKNYAFYELFRTNTHVVSAENLVLPATTLAESCYVGMFSDCYNLTTAPQLPATTLASSCYKIMFNQCRSLTTAQQLPATTLADSCYDAMFQGCTSLTTAPSVLPATTLASMCYRDMFNGCTSLTTAPEFTATTLADSCYYQMFYACYGLTTAPELPATTLAMSCYKQMFAYCTSLTTAPELPATTLDYECYMEMFNGCTSLTAAPELPAETLADNCYQGMFQNCSYLSYITCLATDISATDCTTDWVDGVASTGTFTKAADMTSWQSGTSGIPDGWTVVDE